MFGTFRQLEISNKKGKEPDVTEYVTYRRQNNKISDYIGSLKKVQQLSHITTHDKVTYRYGVEW